MSLLTGDTLKWATAIMENPGIKAVFQQGLNEEVCGEMACQDDEASLYTLIDLAIVLDSLIRDCCPARVIHLPRSPSPLPAEPMQLGSMRLTCCCCMRSLGEMLLLWCEGALDGTRPQRRGRYSNHTTTNGV